MGCGSCGKSVPLRVLKYNSGSPKPPRPKSQPVPVRRKLLPLTAVPKSAFREDNRA